MKNYSKGTEVKNVTLNEMFVITNVTEMNVSMKPVGSTGTEKRGNGKNNLSEISTQPKLRFENNVEEGRLVIQ